MSHLKIVPDYTQSHICHCCKKNTAIAGKEKRRDCYYFDKVFHLNGVAHKYSYRVVEVSVPRCEECEKIEYKSTRINGIVFLICFFLGVYIWSGIFADTDGGNRTWTNVLIACGPSLICAMIITFITGSILDSIFEQKNSISMDCDDYEPIRKLKLLGFVPRDSAPGSKSHDVKERGPLNMEAYKTALSRIINEDHCMLQ